MKMSRPLDVPAGGLNSNQELSHYALTWFSWNSAATVLHPNLRNPGNP
jgi:hypothetical protein